MQKFRKRDKTKHVMTQLTTILMMNSVKKVNDDQMSWILCCKNIILDGDRIISFAPGEGNRPLGLFSSL